VVSFLVGEAKEIEPDPPLKFFEIRVVEQEDIPNH
jgi:hypothetical protein